MKLWYDDRKIPVWVEWLAVIAVGLLFGLLFAIGFLGISFGYILTSILSM
jgi:hypothetical protein